MALPVFMRLYSIKEKHINKVFKTPEDAAVEHLLEQFKIVNFLQCQHFEPLLSSPTTLLSIERPRKHVINTRHLMQTEIK